MTETANAALDALLASHASTEIPREVILARIQARLTTDNAQALFRDLTTLAILLPITDDVRMNTANLAVLGGTVPVLIGHQLAPIEHPPLLTPSAPTDGGPAALPTTTAPATA